jgi:tRNA (cytidine/uridine-2'-O-)-methyltransferase
VTARPAYDVVLVRPEIAENTGNVGRTCMALGCRLHLVHPLGFQITGARLKRAGLDYWEHLDVRYHDSFEAYLEREQPAEKWLLTTKAGRTIYEAQATPGLHLWFGKETAGLPDWLTLKHATDCARLPMFDARVRSLNLSGAAHAVVYEAMRKLTT